MSDADSAARAGDPVGKCECGNAIYRRSASGVPPKRCLDCRRALGGVGAKRGPRSAEHEARGRSAAHDGPVIQIRKLMNGLPEGQRPGGTSLDVSCAAAALTAATGIPEVVGAHIIEAMQALLDDGETGERIRVRLNRAVFGLHAAHQLPPRPPRHTGGLSDYLEEGRLA